MLISFNLFFCVFLDNDDEVIINILVLCFADADFFLSKHESQNFLDSGLTKP